VIYFDAKSIVRKKHVKGLIFALVFSLFIQVPCALTEENATSKSAVQVAPDQVQSARPKHSEPKRVVMARVGDHEITVKEFMQFVSRDGERVWQATTQKGKAALLRELISRYLLNQALYKEELLPVGVKPDKKDYIRALQVLSTRHFPLPPVPEEEALYEYYEQHREEFGIPAMVRVSQIQFLFPDNADESAKKDVRRRAEMALKRLQTGESFEDLAAELTENSRAKVAKGDLGFLDRNADPWLKGIVDGMKVGDHTGVVESPVGYEILLLTDERKPTFSPYGNVRDVVVQRMRSEAREKAKADYVHKLAKEIGVNIVMDGMESAMP
jgi:parvulin-like peptidyl-prolyl isomerase